MTNKHTTALVLLLSTLSFACTVEDNHSDDDGAAPDRTDDIEYECGPVQTPQPCIDIAAHVIECEPEDAQFEDELVGECACDYDELDQTDECIAAFQKLAACLVATPCAELTEASCEAEVDAMASPCGE